MIRRGQVSDAKALAALAEATFRETFGAQNTTENMDLHCRSSYGESIQAAELADPSIATFLIDGAGYAQLRWGKAPPCVRAERPAEISRLYVARERHGTGLGKELMKACLAQAAKGGADAVWLGVWERNPRAIAFYKKCGFIEAGEHVFPVGRDPQRDVVMVIHMTGRSAQSSG